jgi:type IV pilus assembly protein PilE
MKKHLNHGFSLIELMIVVAIVGILAAVAYPAYTNSILKGRRAEARAALAELLQQQERYMTQNNTYLAFTTDTSFVATPSTAPFKTFSGQNSANSYYRLSAGTCPNGSGGQLGITECVQVIATPMQSDPVAGTLTMTSTGTKDCTGGTDSSVCWK